MLDPTSPKRLGDYIVLKTLGSGSTGTVKLARHIRTGDLVALKIIKDSLMMTDAALFKKSRREIAVLKLLSSLTQKLPSRDGHPVASRLGVMQLLDVIDVPDAVVLVLEYCNGGELFDTLVDRGCLPLDLVLDYLQQLAFALRFCHSRGVCHRDLKPENVLLTDDARLKLVDFGMATMHTPGIFLQTSCGSPQYCAPEVLLNEPYDGRVADVWSLGVTLYAMTTGGLPFDDDNMQRLVTKIRTASFYIPPEVPDLLADLLRAMLTPDPADRVSLDDVIAHPWFNSHPPRANVHIEPPCALDAACGPDPPVCEPEPAVVRHLVNLGLGDGMTIKLRLRSAAACREREFYNALSTFRPVMPLSPVAVQHSPPVLACGSPSLKARAAALSPPGLGSPLAACPPMLLPPGAERQSYQQAVSPVVGRPPPLELAGGGGAVAPVQLTASVPAAGSHLLQSMRSLMPAWISALPHEQGAPIATSVGSDGPLSTQVPLS